MLGKLRWFAFSLEAKVRRGSLDFDMIQLITEHVVKVIAKFSQDFSPTLSVLTSLSLMDTRGYADVSYTQKELAVDLLGKRTHQHNKVILVIRNERLYKHTWDMLKATSKMTGGTFVSILTHCQEEQA